MTTTVDAAPRRGILKRIRDWLRGDGNESPPLPVSEDHPLEYTTPALGDAYPFEVRVRVTWHRKAGISRSTMDDCITRRTKHVHAKIARQVRETVRNHLPDQPADAENALNHDLECLACNMTFLDGGVTWSAKAEVAVDHAVRAIMQEQTARYIRQAMNHCIEAERINQIRLLVGRCRRLLDDLGVENAPYLTPHIIRMAAHPDQIAPAADNLAANRLQMDRDMMEIVVEAIASNQNNNTYEAVVGFDAALTRAMEWVKVRPYIFDKQPLPEQEAS